MTKVTTYIAQIDTDVPKPPPNKRGKVTSEEDHANFQRYLTAASGTVELLESHGLKVEPASEDRAAAAAVAIAYAKDPMGTSKKFNTPQKVSNLPPPAVREAHRILSSFGHNVVNDAVQVRNMVTNKLIEESENPDPRVRLKALELLGKISDVGLFSEKSEVTITHQTSDELKAKLREKLSKLVDVTPIEDAEIVHEEETDNNKPPRDTSEYNISEPDTPDYPHDPHEHPEYISVPDTELDTSLWDDEED